MLVSGAGNEMKRRKMCSKSFFLFVIPSALVIIILDINWTQVYKIVVPPLAEETFKYRSATVKLICEQNNLTHAAFSLNHKVAAQLFVEHSHKLIYCEVPKAGCSNWKRIILSLNDSLGPTLNKLKLNELHSSPLLLKLSHYPPSKQKEFLANYTKVMFTRDPLQRVVSAYRDKFLHEDNIVYGKIIARKIKRRLKDYSAKGITFEQFVRFIVIEDPRDRDIHWRPMYQLCDPCSVHYNVIGKLETISRDAKFVLKVIGAPKDLKYPSEKHYLNESRTDDSITRQYLDTLPPDLLRQLLQVYNVDCAMFGYG